MEDKVCCVGCWCVICTINGGIGYTLWCICVCFCPKTIQSCVVIFNSVEIDGNEFHYVFINVCYPCYMFIIFYKCGIWAFLGC